MLHIVKPAAIGARRASVSVNIWQPDGPEDSPSQVSPQAAIRAELIGPDACTARGITVRSSIPILALCRRLIKAGCDPATRLEAYRGGVLCLHVRSIGEGAQLRLAEIFLSNAKAGSHSDAAAKDSAVVCSIALQLNVPVETIRKALLRDPRGNAASPLGTALDLIASAS